MSDYQKQVWVDDETIIDAERMEHIEDGIVAAPEGLASDEELADAIAEARTEIQDDAEQYVDDALAALPVPLQARDPEVTYRFVAGALRKKDGEWALIDDEGHTPSGIESVTDRGEDLRIEYGFTAKKVVSLVCTADETYTSQGYSFGASVGLNGSTIWIMNTKQSPAGGYLAYSGDEWTYATGNVEEVEEREKKHEIRAYHPEPTPATDIYLSITGRGPGKYVYRAEGSGTSKDGRGYTNIGIYNMDGSPVTAFKDDMKLFFVRESAPVDLKIEPSELPEGNSNIWVFGIMEV